jgi:hypothetical protein
MNPQDLGNILLPVLITAAVTSLMTASVATFFLPLTMNLRLREKRRENITDMEQQLQSGFREWNMVWKLWNYSYDANPVVNRDKERRQLLDRVGIAEYMMETILIKICMGRVLSETDMEIMAKFRQAYQALRGAIRHNQRLNWESPTDPQLLALRRGFCVVLQLLQTLELVRYPDAAMGAENFLKITDPKWETSWAEPMKAYPKKLPWYSRLGIPAYGRGLWEL